MMIYQLTNDIICSLQTTTIWKSTLNCFANGFLILNIPSAVLLYQFWWSAVRIQLVFTAGIGEVWRILGDHMVFMTQPWQRFMAIALTKGQRSKRQLWNSSRCPVYIINSVNITKLPCYSWLKQSPLWLHKSFLNHVFYVERFFTGTQYTFWWEKIFL